MYSAHLHIYSQHAIYSFFMRYDIKQKSFVISWKKANLDYARYQYPAHGKRYGLLAAKSLELKGRQPRCRFYDGDQPSGRI